MKLYAVLHELIGKGAVVSAYALDGKGLAAAVSKMAFGNKLGVTIEKEVSEETLFAPDLVISWRRFRWRRLVLSRRH